MSCDPQQHHRRSIRLDGYDCAEPGVYFVTICAEDHRCLFGAIDDGALHLNALGEIVQRTWSELPNHYPRVELDAFVVMPNHAHMVIMLNQDAASVGAGFKPALIQTPAATPTAPKRYGLGEIIRAFKTFSARQINKCCGTPGVSVWQRNYYEHIIRNEHALNHIRQYILANPARWAWDRENPAAIKPEEPDAWRI